MTAGRGAPPPRVTLLDVAQRAGVSRTTASFVMTGRRDMRISADAEQRVLRAARELSYRPSLLARSLRTNLSQTIGLLSDLIASDAFAGEMVRGTMSTALLHEHLTFIGETSGDPELEKNLVQNMLDRGVGGFVYASMYTRRVTVSKTLRNHPVVLLNSVTRLRGVPMVLPDEREGGRIAARALLAHGHGPEIAVVGEVPDHVYAATERLAGINEELAEAGLPGATVIDAEWWPEPAHHAVLAHLAAGNRPTAMICLNDRAAMGCYQAAQAAKLSVPEDLSVISFDNSDLASWLRPGLSSIAIPHFELGRRAVEVLLGRHGSTQGAGAPDASTKAPLVQRVPMVLRERESIAEPRRNPRRSKA